MMKTLVTFIFLLISGTGIVQAAEVNNISDFSLDKYQGKVVYLDFWASWCKPCQKSFPWMNDLQKKYPAEKFQVVTVNLDKKSEDMYEFLKRIPADFVVYHDPSGSIAQQFKLPGMPTSFIINKSGKPLKKHVGFFKDKITVIEAEIEALL